MRVPLFYTRQIHYSADAARRCAFENQDRLLLVILHALGEPSDHHRLIVLGWCPCVFSQRQPLL